MRAGGNEQRCGASASGAAPRHDPVALHAGDEAQGGQRYGVGAFVEVQGSAEGAPFSKDELSQLMALAEKGIGELVEMQKAVIG